ncbi:hypothetical protein H7J88_25075 [Mycolicibacterium flavescens]|uniref:hypothetical protein n=1 Tax=Mycolicibacterium flavescens TaxID=1776 RepID=UPI001041D3BE|nr:hypothetical protein [Mycolicibacterium flavescens]MCV7282914.1 hypothetical protein [Mycolicibacterium flavescens]
MNLDARIGAATETSDTHAQPVTVHEALRRLLDELAEASPPAERGPAYRAGFSAGIRFARICVLDEIAAASGYLDRIAMTNGSRRDRESVRIRAAVRTIGRRLGNEIALGDDDGADGYRDAIAVAQEVVSGLRATST